MKVSDVCRKHGISEPTFYNWQSKYEDMSRIELARMKALEVENSRLKRIVADQQLSITVLQEAHKKKW